VGAGPVTRHYYHIQKMAEKGYDMQIVTAATSTVSDSSVSSDSSLPGIKVKSISIPAVLKDSVAARAGYHLNFFLKSLLHACAIKHPVLVIASIPSLLVGLQGLILAKFRKSKLMIDVRDLWSDSLSTTKLAKIPLFLKLNRFAEKLLYKNAHLITCTSQAQGEEIRKMVGGRVPIVVVPNGLDPDLKDHNGSIHPFVHKIKKTYKHVGIFAGKHSRYASLETLLAVAKAMQNDDFALLFVGGGYTKQALVRLTEKEDLKNVFFHEPVPKNKIASFLLGADIFFINYSKKTAWKNVLPNKIFDYMYYNKPIVAAVVPGEITRILEESGAGVCVPPEQPDEIAAAVRISLGEKGQTLRAKDYILKHFDRKNTVAKFIAAFRRALDS